MAEKSAHSAPPKSVLDEGHKLLNKGALPEALAHCKALSAQYRDSRAVRNHTRQLVSKFVLISDLYDAYIDAMHVPPETVAPKRTLDQALASYPIAEAQIQHAGQKPRPNRAAKARQKAHDLYVHGKRDQALSLYLNAVPSSLASAKFEPLLVSQTADGHSVYRAGETYFAVSSRHKNVRYFAGAAFVLGDNRPQTWFTRTKSQLIRFIYFNVAMPLIGLWQRTLKKFVAKIILALIRYKRLFAQLYDEHPAGKRIPSVTAPSLEELKDRISAGSKHSNKKHQ